MGKKSILMLVGITILGISFLFYTTDHFQAFTAEQARRIDVLNNRPQIPNVTLEDSTGKTFTFSALKGKYVLATFIYASCGEVCPLVEINFNKIYSSLPPDILGEKLQLLSISFDLARDTPMILEHHREMYEADGADWKMVRVPDQKELDFLLKKAGVIVIPIKNGFEHNAAFYLFNPEGRLIRIFNYDPAEKVVEELKQEISF
ncbi:SCO family protein [Neobacillus sp. SAB-20_R2A]|uniref:SCO family protein n=1 Tax=Neobacillus sp. SAB-20_R2A TaxID=3120519 RepID=UPI003C6E6B16